MSQRSFSADVKQLGFFRALDKRWFRFRVGRRRYRYRDLLVMNQLELQALAKNAADEGIYLYTWYAFEAMWTQWGVEVAWRGMWTSIEHLDDERATHALNVIRRSVKDGLELPAPTDMDIRCCYLLGTMCLADAKRFQGRNRQLLEAGRKKALELLWSARERAERDSEDLEGAPFRGTAAAGELYERIDAMYEAATSLQYDGADDTDDTFDMSGMY